MAHDLLTPLVSTISSEFVFSITTNIIVDKKKTLVAKMLEVLTCLKDWEDGRMGLQTLEDELKEDLEKLDLNTNNDVQEIDDD